MAANEENLRRFQKNMDGLSPARQEAVYSQLEAFFRHQREKDDLNIAAREIIRAALEQKEARKRALERKVFTRRPKQEWED